MTREPERSGLTKLTFYVPTALVSGGTASAVALIFFLITGGNTPGANQIAAKLSNLDSLPVIVTKMDALTLAVEKNNTRSEATDAKLEAKIDAVAAKTETDIKELKTSYEAQFREINHTLADHSGKLIRLEVSKGLAAFSKAWSRWRNPKQSTLLAVFGGE